VSSFRDFIFALKFINEMTEVPPLLTHAEVARGIAVAERY
jgi:hypothetical protein